VFTSVSYFARRFPVAHRVHFLKEAAAAASRRYDMDI
jgi:hypothetical protein